jgi:hypothetical protein
MNNKELKIYNEGITARQQNQNSNPYIDSSNLKLHQRLLFSNLAKRSYLEWAHNLWQQGWNHEHDNITLVEERIHNEELARKAQNLFDYECFMDHKRLEFLMNHFIKQNGGYLDLQIIAFAKANMGENHLKVHIFKQWIDNAMNQQKGNTN